MSTTNSIGLPDITDMQRLANELFKALPNEFPKEISLSPNASEHPRATKIAETLLSAVPQYVPFDTYFGQSSAAPLATPTVPSNLLSGLQTPPSIGGAGISPSLSQYGNIGAAGAYPGISPNLAANGQPQNPVISSSNGGRVPVSVAGSGASPSAVQHGNEINIAKPQTSFPDSNLQKGLFSDPAVNNRIPYFGINNLPLPFEADESFVERELKTALASINSNVGLPLGGIHAATPNSLEKAVSFYFLQDNPFAFDKKPPIHPEVGFPFTEKSNKGPGSLTGRFGFDANLIKKDFPILSEKVNGKPLIWLDNAATTQKPRSVIERLVYFYEHENSNIHRAAHEIASRATDAYEEARKKVQNFLNAGSQNEIVFVRGTTEGINLVAKSWGEQNLKEGDEIILSHLEHHANIVPWQQLANKNGLKLRVIPVNDEGELLLDEYAKLLNAKTKLVSFTQVSNALGTVTPAKKIIDMAHQAGAKVLLDGAQSVSHLRADVQALDCDWFVFSGHKVFGPTGIGVLYGKEAILNETQPWQGGGNMIKDVTFEHTKYHNAPTRFEAGTGNIADAVGLGAAIDYVTILGIDNIKQYEHALLLYAINLLKDVPGIRLIGTAKEKTSVMSFTLQGYKNDEVGKALNLEGIAVRTGNHCAQPILRRMGVESTVRPSLALYNTCADVDKLVETLWKLKGKK